MINWARVEELRNDMGNEGFEEVVELFLEEMSARIADIRINGDTNRADDLHFLKGCAANVGFAKLQEFCLTAEHDTRVGLEAIFECYEQSKGEFLNGAPMASPHMRTPDNTSSSVMSR